MKRTATFDAITRLLSDGAWHAVDDLRDVTGWPVEWVDELAAEGLVDTREQIGHTLVRLRPREPAAVS